MPKDEGTENGGGDGANGDESGGEETFTKEYVESLRKENANYRQRVKTAEEQAEALKEAQMSAQEKAIEEARKAGMEEAEKLFKPLLAKERIKAQAAGEFTDPNDAIAHLDLEKIDVDDDYAIGEALTELLKEKPYLAAKSRTTNIDQGPKGKTVDPKTGSDWVRSIAGRG